MGTTPNACYASVFDVLLPSLEGGLLSEVASLLVQHNINREHPSVSITKWILVRGLHCRLDIVRATRATKKVEKEDIASTQGPGGKVSDGGLCKPT